MWFPALLTVALSAPAHALDCLAVSVGSMLPTDGAIHVPVNAHPMVQIYGDSDRSRLVLLADGVEVEGATWTRLTPGDPEVWQLSDDFELAANTAYMVQAFDESVTDERWMMGEFTFTTGEATDEEAPEAIRSVVPSYTYDSDDWGPSSRFELAIEGGEDSSGVAWLLEFDDSTDFSEPEFRIRMDNPAAVAHGLCTFDDVGEWDPDRTVVRITPVDAAGNLGEPVVAAFSSEDSDELGKCGTRCSAMPVGTFGVFSMWVGLMAVGRRTREA
jgi:hypothetical protein